MLSLSRPSTLLFTSLSVIALLALTACNEPQHTKIEQTAAAGAIDTARLKDSTHKGEWLTTGGGWTSAHYSALTTLNATNVERLGLAWSFETGTQRGLEATPIVVDGTLFTSGVAGRVYALDATTGTLKWRFEPDVDLQVTRATCCDQVNRGVAVWRGRVYVASLDGWLYSLDARTGQVIWKQDTIADRQRGYTITGAPQVAGRGIVIGNAGADFDARGYITSYDLETGAQLWRLYTVPGDPRDPPENPELVAAAKTWDPKAAWAQGGGGAVWDGMAWDPDLNLLYVGTGNAGPFLQARRSPAGGDNLYTSSILAIAADSGRLVWHFQETPADQWDFDATAPLVLADREVNGVARKLLLHAPKNGVFYVLDRVTGKLVSAMPFARVNWSKGFDRETGRPDIDAQAADYSGSAKVVFPSFVGAHNWNPMAYSPATGLVYLPTTEMGGVLFDTSEGATYRRGLLDNNVGVLPGPFIEALRGFLPPPIQTALDRGELLKNVPDLRARAFLQAWDPITHKQVWRSADAEWWDHAGVLATAGDLVFQGDATGALRAFDARTGKVLKTLQTYTSIIAAPMIYEADGTTYVAVMAAWGGGAWAGLHPGSAAYQYGNRGRILAFKLDGGAVPEPAPLPPVPPIPEPPPQLTPDRGTIARGAQLFNSNCAICHPHQGRTGSADLRRLTAAKHAVFDKIVRDGLLKGLGMPAWGDVLSESDTRAIHAYLIDLSWSAYHAERAAAGKPAPERAAAPTRY